MKKIAHCIHHTHWDLIWYFTAQDAAVQFSYNMKEMLQGFRNGEIVDFFMDGQSAPIDEYLRLHPEDTEYMKELISSEKLIIGPFNSQLDCFISNGESVINNLRLGIKSAKELGKVSKIAYLPDSFGHSVDFPKIFNQFGIYDFVITRGLGDNYNLGSEFYMESNDGSQLLVCAMVAGYGYGCYGFKEGTLFSDTALDYNKINVTSLIDRLLRYSTLKDEFVFPLGFDQNPAILNIPKKIEEYNQESATFEFQLTTWKDFCQRVRTKGENLKIHKDELYSTQYHRVHKSIFSARADIKALQDRCERILTFELQPLMSMLDSLGILYDHGLIDKAWETLVKCQTHSTATLTDETNDFIERETKNALHLADSTKTYLMKLVSLSLGNDEENSYPLVVFNTLPKKRKMIIEAKVFSKTPGFKISDGKEKLDFSVIKSVKKNCGVLRKDKSLIDPNKFYYETDIVLQTNVFNGISYKTYTISNSPENLVKTFIKYDKFIENERYKIYQDEEGITIFDKKRDQKIEKAMYLEESGDEGDSFDYSYPNHDLRICDFLDDATISYTMCDEMSVMDIRGEMRIPADLTKRKHQECDNLMPYHLYVTLKKDSDIIEVKGEIDNHSKQHRVRFVITGNKNNQYSYAGTQFGYIKRETNPKELQTWKKDNWFEEPSPTFPLLNHVSTVHPKTVITVFTRSSKEYELVGDGYQDIAITVFRSYGAMGYPDLNRRPGRPSGLDYMIFETPRCQMEKINHFEIAFTYYGTYDANKVNDAYIDYACQDSYYQKQDFDKSINPIAYFPTNPLPQVLPKDYEFLCLDEFVGNFGTVVKSDIDNGYLVRLYNSENKEINGGVVDVVSQLDTLTLTNLEESRQTEVSSLLPKMKQGELRILKLNHK